ncbi:MAG: lysylphosphatidylglycerol synthase domain-containing protein [Burkholderiaceae bacterium]
MNVFAPRGGEVARLLSICKSEKLPWAGVLPTLLIDRLLDVAFLLAVFGLTLLILPPALLNAMPWLQSGGLVLLIVVIVGLGCVAFYRHYFYKALENLCIPKDFERKLTHQIISTS